MKVKEIDAGSMDKLNDLVRQLSRCQFGQSDLPRTPTRDSQVPSGATRRFLPTQRSRSVAVVPGARHIHTTRPAAQLRPCPRWVADGRARRAQSRFWFTGELTPREAASSGTARARASMCSRMEGGKLTEPELAAETPNPSWLAVHPDRRYLVRGERAPGSRRKGIAG